MITEEQNMPSQYHRYI